MKEFYHEISQELSINIVNNQVSSIRHKNIESSSLRIYEKDCIGIGGCMGVVDAEDLENKANDMLKRQISYPFEPCHDHSESVDLRKPILSDQELLEETEWMLSFIQKKHPEFIISNSMYINESEIQLKNERNLNLSFRDRNIAFVPIFKDKMSSNIMDGYMAYSGREYNRDIMLDYFSQILSAYNNPVNLPDKQLPVLFHSDNHFFRMKLIQEIDGLAMGTKSSLLTDKIGQKLFHENFSLTQDNNPMTTFSSFFDMEGWVNPDYRFPLIENGVFLHPYTDKRTAHTYNLTPTGSAGGSYDSIPGLNSPSTRIQESDLTTAQLLNGEQGILVYITSGGDFTSSGNMGAPVQLAFLVEDGRLVGKLPELQVQSSLYDMFGQCFRGVGKDVLYPGSSDHYIVFDMKTSKI